MKRFLNLELKIDQRKLHSDQTGRFSGIVFNECHLRPGGNLQAQKSPQSGLIQLFTFFGTIADNEIIKPVRAAIINGNMKASEVLSGFFISNRITMKNALVAKVDDE
ncbi:TPA: hypothetical protein NHU03_002308 [Escherichia coli]|nr:hypothetical protein [Escherichia coli]